MELSDEFLEPSKRMNPFLLEPIYRKLDLKSHKKRKQRLKWSGMKEQVLKHLMVCQFERIEPYLQSYTPPEVAMFYKRKSWVFFHWAILVAPTPEPLVFLVDYFPVSITLNAFMSHDFSILEGFLRA